MGHGFLPSATPYWTDRSPLWTKFEQTGMRSLSGMLGIPSLSSFKLIIINTLIACRRGDLLLNPLTLTATRYSHHIWTNYPLILWF